MSERSAEVGTYRFKPSQYYIGRLVLNSGLQRIRESWRQTLTEAGYWFKGMPDPLSLRQVDLRHFGLACKSSADKILNQIPQEMRSQTHELWAVTYHDFSRGIKTPETGWRSRHLTVVLQREKTGEPEPGPLADERQLLHWTCKGPDELQPKSEGAIILGRVVVRLGREFDSSLLAGAMTIPVPVRLGPLKAIPELPSVALRF